MLATLVALLSLDMTASMVARGQAYATLPVIAATATTPIVVTSPAHGVPLARKIHGVVAGIVGTTEANGTWVLTPVDADNFALSAFSAQGVYAPSVGINAYVSGGTISYAFPDGQILLGRRMQALNSAAATPRILFVPVENGPWGLEPYGGVGDPAPFDPGSTEVQAQYLGPQLATEPTTFDVYVTGCQATQANELDPDPDFGDFEATQALYHALYVTITQGTGQPRGRLLKSYWPSQLPPNHPLATGTQSQRGQQWCGRYEFQQPVYDLPSQFTTGTLVFDVTTVAGGSSDDVIFTVG